MLTALYLLGVFTAIACASSLIQRKIYDPYIICHNPPPPFYSLPAGYYSQDYQTTMDLCSAANGRRSHNVGCFCSASEGDLHCDANLADPVLSLATTDWFNRTNDHAATFVEFCELACYCADIKSAALAWSSTQRNSALNRILNRPNITATYIGRIEPDDSETVYNSQCGSVCSNHTDCASGADGCLCKTQSEQYVPGKGIVMFAAACMISLGGKREEQPPCPCNGTYVSHSCCDATDGIVHEPEHFKLGELRSSHDL